MRERVVVGMSGGVDSFVTALLLKQQGYEVTGVNLELWGKNDLQEMEHICRQLQIPFLICHGEELFRRIVVDDFISKYRMGSTPSPCCVCNNYVKWELLRQVADEVGATRIATGHYIRLAEMNGRKYLRKGVDPQKDQSYFLWGISPDILEKALTPLGEFRKEEVKALAVKYGYERIAKRRESMGVCFLRGRDYRDFIKEHGGIEGVPGDILNMSGETIGRHSGVENYTVGQKQGLPSIPGQSLYVVDLDAGRNVVIAGVKSDLWSNVIYLEHVRLAAPEDLNLEITVKVRGIGMNPQGTAIVDLLPGNRACVRLSDPAWAVAPGQPVVFFHDDWVLGGGYVYRKVVI